MEAVEISSIIMVIVRVQVRRRFCIIMLGDMPINFLLFNSSLYRSYFMCMLCISTLNS